MGSLRRQIDNWLLHVHIKSYTPNWPIVSAPLHDEHNTPFAGARYDWVRFAFYSDPQYELGRLVVVSIVYFGCVCACVDSVHARKFRYCSFFIKLYIHE